MFTITDTWTVSVWNAPSEGRMDRGQQIGNHKNIEGYQLWSLMYMNGTCFGPFAGAGMGNRQNVEGIRYEYKDLGRHVPGIFLLYTIPIAVG